MIMEPEKLGLEFPSGIDEADEKKIAEKLAEAMWSGDVKTKWHPEEGFFKKGADAIASGLKSASSGLKQAMGRLNFYINRAGSGLSTEDKSRLEGAKKKLQALYGESVTQTDWGYPSGLTEEEVDMVIDEEAFGAAMRLDAMRKEVAEYQKKIDDLMKKINNVEAEEKRRASLSTTYKTAM